MVHSNIILSNLLLTGLQIRYLIEADGKSALAKVDGAYKFKPYFYISTKHFSYDYNNYKRKVNRCKKID